MPVALLPPRSAECQSVIHCLTCHACVAFGTEQPGCDFLAGKLQHISIFSFLTAEPHEGGVLHSALWGKHKSEGTAAPAALLERTLLLYYAARSSPASPNTVGFKQMRTS